jgi:apolipoprotein N-acyltransferase
VLLNPGNYGWFGETGFRSQIAALARLRAAELAVTVVMAGNTGPSAFYDPLGRTFGRFQGLDTTTDEPAGGVETTYRQGYAHATIRAAQGGTTVYARIGDAGWWLLALGSLLVALIRGRRTLPEKGIPGYTRVPGPGSHEGNG